MLAGLFSPHGLGTTTSGAKLTHVSAAGLALDAWRPKSEDACRDPSSVGGKGHFLHANIEYIVPLSKHTKRAKGSHENDLQFDLEQATPC